MTAHGIDPRELRLLTAHVMGTDAAWVIAHPDHRYTAPQERRLRALTMRRRQGEPIAYLTGEKEFYGHVFYVGRGVLVPRPESEHLIDEALRILPAGSRGTIIDVGTGSGCLAVSVALARPSVRVYAIDRSPVACACARRNAKRHAVTRRITLLRGDLLQPVLTRRIKPVCIMANLPYATPQEYRAVRSEPRAAIVGGRDGMAAFRRFFRQLRRSGLQVPVILEIDPQRVKQTARLAHAAFPHSTISVHKDLAGFPRILSIHPHS